MTDQTNPQPHEITPRPTVGKRWRRFEKAVPGSVRQALVERLLREVDPATRAALYDVFALGQQYGVSRRQFRHFADRVPCVRQAGKTVLRPTWPAAGSPLAEVYRDWMDRACEMMNSLTEKLSTDDSDTWEHAVYMALLVRLFAVLAGQASELPIRDLTGASQVVNGPTRAKSAKPSKTQPREDRAEQVITDDALRTAVRKIYGLDLSDSWFSRSAARSQTQQ